MRLRSGLALILVVGVLGVLAVLGSAFAMLSRMERLAATQRVLGTQATLLSRSGIEDALARIAMGQDADTYGGEDWAGDGWDAYDQSQEVYRPGVMNAADCPVQQALRPSFFVREGTGKPKRIPVSGKERGFSGQLSQGTWALKVQPHGFWINGGDNATLRRMMGNLTEALDREDGTNDGIPVDQTDGWKLVDTRPPAGWASWSQVRDLALGGSPVKLEALKPYLTLSAWVDRKVVAPNYSTSSQWSSMQSFLMYCHNEVIPGSLAPAFEPRAPVSLSWARKRRPALIALLGGLKGAFVDENSNIGCFVGNNDLWGSYKPAELILSWTQTSDDCRRVAEQILISTSELSTWDQWEALCDSLDVDATGFTAPSTKPAVQANQLAWGRQAKRDLLKANFNPNTDLNKLGPNLLMHNRIDKQDMIRYSTEFSLAPVQGHEVQSVSRVSRPDGRLLASRTLGASVSGPVPVTLTTQREFVCGDLGDPSVAGDESGVRLPGEAGFLSLSRSPLSKTWGHRLGGLGGQGIALQSYPEPHYDAGGGLPILAPADYDGSLQLATIETEDDEDYAVPAAVKDMKMLAPFTLSPDLALADSGNKQAQTYGYLPTSLMDSGWPGYLRPDGAYSDHDVINGGWSPSYLDRGSAHPHHGVLSFWVKRSYELPISDNQYTQKGREWVKWSNITSPGLTDTIYWVLGDYRCKDDFNYQRGMALMFELAHDGADALNEGVFRGTPDLAANETHHRWFLVTCFWDFCNPIADDMGELILNDGVPDSERAMDYIYPLAGGGTAFKAEDLTADDLYGPHTISLGGDGWRQNHILVDAGTGADSTFDEFVIYDLGGAGHDATPPEPNVLPSVDLLALKRFREGRYYKGSEHRKPTIPGWIPDEAASWVSAPIPLPGGSILKSVHWTWRRPEALPTDYAEVELVTLSGNAYAGSEEGSRSTRGPGWTRDRQDWAVPGPIPSPFRLRVVFRRETPVDDNTPILESPVLDDVTLLYEPKGGPRILNWGNE